MSFSSVIHFIAIHHRKKIPTSKRNYTYINVVGVVYSDVTALPPVTRPLDIQTGTFICIIQSAASESSFTLFPNSIMKKNKPSASRPPKWINSITLLHGNTSRQPAAAPRVATVTSLKHPDPYNKRSKPATRMVRQNKGSTDESQYSLPTRIRGGRKVGRRREEEEEGWWEREERSEEQ